MTMNVTTISQKMKNNRLLNIEKILKNDKKYIIIIIIKYFNLKNFASYKGNYKKLFLLMLRKFPLNKFF